MLPKFTSLQLSTRPQLIGGANEESSSENRTHVIIPAHLDTSISIRSIYEKCKSKLSGFLSSSSQNEDEAREDGLCQPARVTTNQGVTEMKESSRLVNRLERDGQKDSNVNEGFKSIIHQAGDQTEVRQIGACRHFFFEGDDVPDMNLVVKIQQLEWYNHSHLLPEEKYAIELKRTYRSFEEIQGRREFEHVLRKAMAIMLKIEKLINHVDGEESKGDGIASTSNQDGISALYKEMIFSIYKLVSIEHQVFTAYASILQKWHAICGARTGQGFHCTSITLGKRQKEDTVMHDKCSLVINQLFDSLDRMSTWNGDILVGNQGSGNEVKTLVKLMEVVDSTRSSRLHLVLTFENDDTVSGIVRNARELRRRRMVESERYVAKLIVDGRLVGSTSAQNIDWQSWTVSFNQTFQCSMMIVPSSCCVQICQRSFMGLLPDKCICSMFISFPGCDGKPSVNPSMFPMLAPKRGLYHFQSTKLAYDIEGAVEVETMWIEVTPTCNRIRQPDYLVANTSDEKYQLQGTITKHSNDMHTSCPTSSTMALNHDSMSFRMWGTRHSYLNPHRFQESVRHYLIRRQEASGSNRTSVPLNEADNSQDTMKSILADRKSRYRHDDDLVEAACMERPAANRRSVIKYVTCLRRFRQENGHPSECSMKMKFENFVHDHSRILAQDPSPDLSWIINMLLPPRKRSLYPKQDQKASVAKGTQLLQQSRIILTVISALDTPMREEIMITNSLASPPPIRRLKADMPFLSPSDKHAAMPTEETSVLNAKVQINFCGKKYSTRPTTRKNPSWKEVVEIVLPFDKEESFTPQKLENFGDPIEVILFDMVEVDFGGRGGYYNDEITTYTEERYLGSVRVPLAILHDQPNLNGCFILNTPDVSFGYAHRTDDPSGETSVDFGSYREFSTRTTRRLDDEELQLKSGQDAADPNHRKKSIALSMLLCVEPRVHLKNDSQIAFKGCESSELVQSSLQWLQNFIRINPSKSKRQFPLLINCSNGKSLFVTSILQDQAPPLDCQASLSQCAHYVSLLPFLCTWQAFANEYTYDVWHQSQDALDLAAGDWCSHAALLANFFSYLNNVDDSETFDVYLVFGNSIVEGKVVYVMTKPCKQYSAITLWNPASGVSFSEDDEKCPLYNISALVSKTNVYGNLQAEGSSSRMDFNVADSKCWHAFFGHGILNQERLPSPFQESSILYEEPNETFGAELEIEILDTLKTSIRSWRSIPSTFNNAISIRLSVILGDLEERKLNGLKVLPAAEYYKGVEGLCKGKRIVGFSLHFQFSSVKEIVEAIQSTSIHESKHPSVEFSVAVKVVAYASNLYSIWVFIASQIPD